MFDVMFDVLILCFEIELFVEVVFDVIDGLLYVVVFDFGIGSGVIVVLIVVECFDVCVWVFDCLLVVFVVV